MFAPKKFTRGHRLVKNRRGVKHMALNVALAGIAIGTLVLLATLPRAHADTGRDVIGIWYEESGDGAIELKPCGQSICGYIVWLKEPRDKRGRPMLDANNRDPAKRTQPLCNMQLIGGGRRLEDGSLERGWIYNPEDGARYDVDISRIGPDRLKVHGYLGAKFLGETFTWRRAPDKLDKCSV